MGALGIIDRILGIVRFIEKRLGQSIQEWAKWAAENPKEAALGLEMLAGSMEARARARRRQGGWIARRLKFQAEAFRKQARQLRAMEACP